MAVPKYNELMLPFLQFAGDGQEHHVQEAIEKIAIHLHLNEEQLSELVPSGKKTKYYDRVHWAKTYLTKAQLVKSVGRGLFIITQRGYSILEKNPSHIDKDFLSQFPEFLEFQNHNDTETSRIELVQGDTEKVQTPEEQIEALYVELRKSLSDELLETVLAVSPRFFERLVLDLLLKMGYGSSLDSGQHTGQSGDGGIDGLIREDKLGLDTIYIQAKRYSRDNGVSRSDVQSFVGSLMGLGASKGVFITTSYFTQQTIEYAKNVKNAKVILIDGQQLATLMIEHNVGVAIQKVYEIKQVDENYFPNA
jgi:restriction system protein